MNSMTNKLFYRIIQKIKLCENIKDNLQIYHQIIALVLFLQLNFFCYKHIIEL